DLETAARTMTESQRAAVYELMAATYQACSAALPKLGEPEAAWIAADRAMAAAERAGNAMLVAAGASGWDSCSWAAGTTTRPKKPPELPPTPYSLWLAKIIRRRCRSGAP